MEDCLYEITSMRHFAKLSIDEIPDEITILNFRHLMEKHQVGGTMFGAINSELETEGLLMKTTPRFQPRTKVKPATLK